LEQSLKNETFMVTYGDGVCDLDLGSWSNFTGLTAALQRLPQFGRQRVLAA